MLREMRISYRNYDDSDFDINNYKNEEKKYAALLAQAHNITPSDDIERDLVEDYIDTLTSIISSYREIEIIKKQIRSIRYYDSDEYKQLINKAKSNAASIYYRQTDLYILETARSNMLKRLLQGCESNISLNTNNQTDTPKTTSSSAQITRTSTRKEKIMEIITSKRIAAAISLLLCVFLYFALLTTAFTYKVDTFIVYTQTGTDVIHGNRLCHTDEWLGLHYKYVLDQDKPIIMTTAYDCPNHKWCTECSKHMEETTVTRRDYVTPLLISIPISGLLLFVLVYKKSY